MKQTKEDFNSTIGNQLKEIRIQKRMTREQLAERAGISAKYLYEVEMGRKNCSLYIIYKISRCLEINVDFIIQEGELVKPHVLNNISCHLKKSQKEQLKEVVRILCETIDSIK